MASKNKGEKMKNGVHRSQLSLLKLTKEEGFTKKEIASSLRQNFGEVIKAEYPKIYRIFRKKFSYYTGSRSSVLELLAEFDDVSGELVKFTGWLEGAKGDDDKSDYFELNLTPLKTKDGIIYHLKGTIEEVNITDEGQEIRKSIPLSAFPVYGVPSGKIIELRPEILGASWIFEDANVEYRSLEIRLEECD